MSDKPDNIDELFRANQHRLEEAPSPQAWKRLDRRLSDHRQTRIRTINPWRNWLSIAAGLALILGVASVLLFTQPPGDTMTAESVAIERYSEELEPTSTAANYPVLSPERDYSGSDVREGNRGKRLQVKQPQASNADLTIAETQSPRFNAAPSEVAEFKPSEEIVEAEEEMEEKTEKATKPAPPAAQVAEEVPVTEDPVFVAEDVAAEPVPYVAEADIVKETMKREPTATPAAKAKKFESNSAPTAIPEYNVTSNQLEYITEQSGPSIDQFQWIIGQWSTTGQNGETISFEEWELEDAFTIRGSGYLSINGQQSLVEQMEIKKIGKDLYFITAIDASAQPISFKLKSITSTEAIFEHTISNQSQQIIIQQSTRDNFTTILQNEAQSNLNNEEIEFLRQRNATSEERAVRSLKRVQN
ncbi:MAG: DUF6265 family protein [Bacteroidota bacterium]